MSGRVFCSCSANALIQSNFELISRLDRIEFGRSTEMIRLINRKQGKKCDKKRKKGT